MSGSPPEKNNICSRIVANNLCIGCGLCAAICPHQNLTIEFNEYGEYTAREQHSTCPETCETCLKVCPFSDNCEDEGILGDKLYSNYRGVNYMPWDWYAVRQKASFLPNIYLC